MTRKEAEQWVMLGEKNGILLAADLVKNMGQSGNSIETIVAALRSVASQGIFVHECKQIEEFYDREQRSDPKKTGPKEG